MSEDHHSDELYVRQKKLDELREKGVQPYGEVRGYTSGDGYYR